MKAFISYSHKDANYLEKLKVHLAQIRREGLITEWTDQEIIAGSNLDSNISNALSSSQLFISIVSPDYIASHYCYEKEFKTALDLLAEGKIIIVPIIVEPCEWKSTPMGSIKSLPDDGLPVSEWTNPNNAFAKIAEEIRRLLTRNTGGRFSKTENTIQTKGSSRSYKTEKTFTEIDRLDFKEKGYENIKIYFKSAIAKFNGIENLQARFIIEEKKYFSCLISNKGNLKDAYITISISENERFGSGDLSYNFTQNVQQNTIIMDKMFSVNSDEYHLFWEQKSIYSRSEVTLTDKQIAEKIWDDYISQVGVS